MPQFIVVFFLFLLSSCGIFEFHDEQKIIICMYVTLSRANDMYIVQILSYLTLSLYSLCLISFYRAPLNKSHADNWLEFAIPFYTKSDLAIRNAIQNL